MSVKILEYKNGDWVKGISSQPNLALGGLFQVYSGSDPFETGGLAQPSLAYASQSLGTTPLSVLPWNSGSTNYLYALSATKLYQVLKDSPYTVVDETAQIGQNLIAGGITNTMGTYYWKGKFIYACIANGTDGYIQANTFPVASANDQTLQHGFNSNMDWIAMMEGADGNLYCGNNERFYSQTTASGTSNGTTQTNNGNVFHIDPGFNVRDLVNDGRYLVIFADNNDPSIANRATGSYKCRIYFWDMVQTDGNGRIVCDVIWNFMDSYIIGAKVTEGNSIIMFTYNGIWTLNVSSFPRMIRPNITNTAKQGRPTTPAQILYYKGSVYWVDGTSNLNFYVYAYGNPITGNQKIFYVPYSTGGNNGVAHCLAVSGNNFIVGQDTPGLWFYNTGSTRGSVQITSLDTNMVQPHTFDSVKVVLGSKMGSGDQVQCVVYGNGQSDVISNEIKTFSAIGAKQSMLFRRTNATSNNPTRFEDIVITVTSTVPLQRVAVYATPLDDTNEDL